MWIQQSIIEYLYACRCKWEVKTNYKTTVLYIFFISYNVCKERKTNQAEETISVIVRF